MNKIAVYLKASDTILISFIRSREYLVSVKRNLREIVIIWLSYVYCYAYTFN